MATTTIADLTRQMAAVQIASVRCDGRIRGEPFGVLFRPAQCPRTAVYRLVRPETDTTEFAFRRVKNTHTAAENEGSVYLCHFCYHHWKVRREEPEAWHGIFDCDDIPATSRIGQPPH